MRRSGADLPPMASCDGCMSHGGHANCCTIVRARPTEVKRIRAFVRENDVEWAPPVIPGPQIACGFLRLDGERPVCAIYEVRPWVCRAYGVVKELSCPWFPEEAVIDLPPSQAILSRFSDPEDAFLGEAFEPGYLQRMKAELAVGLPEGITV